MSDLTTVTTPKGKTFWDKPEGLWGMCLAGVAIGGILWFLTWFVPMMLSLGLGIIWGTIVSIGYVLCTDNPLRQAAVLKLQITSRALRSAVVNEDPIAILRLLQTKARKRLDEFQSLMMPVKQSKISVSNAAKSYAETLATLKAELVVRQTRNDSEGATRTLSKIGKTQKYYDDMIFLQGDVEKMDEMLRKAQSVVKGIIEDAEFEIRNEEIHFNAVKNVHGAWKSLRKVFNASTDEVELRAEALRATADQCDARLGQVDQFMDEFKVVLDSVGTADAINAEKARQQMAALGNSSLNVLEVPALKVNQPVAVPR